MKRNRNVCRVIVIVSLAVMMPTFPGYVFEAAEVKDRLYNSNPFSK